MSKMLLIVTAIVEGATGCALIIVPSTVVELLLGEGLPSPQSMTLGRITGFALVALGTACWFARSDAPRVHLGLIGGLLIYNLAVPLLLVQAALATGMQGILLWPAVALHAVMAAWCVLSLCRRC